jgi:uridine kinase
MNAAAKATVVSVAAPPGGGKTTLARTLSAKLSDAPIVHYDDYEKLTQRGPAEIEAWLDRGARLDEIPIPGFAEKIAALAVSGTRFVIVDAPVGRAHAPTAALIDFLIFIDTPLDVALARVIRGQASLATRAAEPGAVRNFAGWLEGYLDNYVRFMRRSYEMQRAAVMPQADLVLDGMLPPQRLTELAVAVLSERAR